MTPPPPDYISKKCSTATRHRHVALLSSAGKYMSPSTSTRNPSSPRCRVGEYHVVEADASHEREMATASLTRSPSGTNAADRAACR
jgi:hypothetical protein